MITILSRFFIKDSMDENARRGAYGMLCGIVGILLNLILFAGKFLAGILSGSIAITADAANNLSDAGSSIITLVGFKLAGQKPDPEHPFGHGRMEYLSGLAVSAIILVMAFELLRDSVAKIFHPEETEFSLLILGILFASILVKLYMAYYNTAIGKKYDSATIRAVATDSLSDCITTTIVIVATLVQHFTSLRVDGYCGIIVGFLIMWAGIQSARETVDPLLGSAPSREYVQKIANLVLSFDSHVVGMHDLIVHDYGPGRQFITLHAEVPEEGNIVELHEIIDRMEKYLNEELGCLVTIHMDPVTTKDAYVNDLKAQLAAVVRELHAELTIHDFRMVRGEKQINLIFDMVVPYTVKESDVQLKEQLQAQVHDYIGPEYAIVVEIDRCYV